MAKPDTIRIPVILDVEPKFTPPTAIAAEGARVAVSNCLECGAAVLSDPRDNIDRQAQHVAWHRRNAHV